MIPFFIISAVLSIAFILVLIAYHYLHIIALDPKKLQRFAGVIILAMFFNIIAFVSYFIFFAD